MSKIEIDRNNIYTRYKMTFNDIFVDLHVSGTIFPSLLQQRYKDLRTLRGNMEFALHSTELYVRLHGF